MIADPAPGDVIDGRFAILECIGRGGMASVYRATDMTTGDVVALKVPFFEFESDPAFYSRFLREQQIGQSLDHPSIVKMLHVNGQSRPYVAMEYVDGETLWDRLQRDRPMPLGEAVRIAVDTCKGLEYLHQNSVVHRDLKPANIMLCRDESVRIMDFGLALSGAARRLTFAGFAGHAGTPHYMAPEQVKGRRGDARTDLFALGAILYEMTTGHLPYDEQPDDYSMIHARLVGDPKAPRAHNQAITLQLEEIMLRALERHPEDRYQSAADFKTDLLDPASVTITGRARRLTVPTMRAQWKRFAGIVGVALIAPVVLFYILLLLLRR
jgi:serine/threonine-protein kinase